MLYNDNMKIVNLSDTHGDIKQKQVGFSFWFCFFGPLYLMVKLRFISCLFLLIIYYYLLPIPGMEIIKNFILQFTPDSYQEIITRFLMFFRNDYARYVGIIIVVFFQIFASFFMEGLLLRKSIKKRKYLPVNEDDARLLISIHACSRKVPLASSRIKDNTNNINYTKKETDVPYIINDFDNSKLASFRKSSMKKKIEDLNELYRLEQMTKEEYEIRRSQIINEYKQKQD